MTTFSLLMLGKLVFLFFCFCCCYGFTSESSGFSLFFSLFSLFFFLIIKTVCFDCSYFTTGILTRGDINIFRLLRQVSTRCSLAKALSFWRVERLH